MNTNETSKIDNLWGDLPVEDVRTPHVVLREQASILTEMTKEKLIGRVVKEKFGNVPNTSSVFSETVAIAAQPRLLTPERLAQLKQRQIEYVFSSRLEILVPSIDNYSISIVQIDYPLKYYPLRIMNLVTDDYRFDKCHTEAELNRALASILSSAEVKRIIAGLLSEIRADEKEIEI